MGKLALIIFACLALDVTAAFATELKIVFQSTLAGGDLEIFIMDPDGSNVVQLTDNTDRDTRPSWSPNGSQIVFTSNRDGDDDIYIMDADGSSVLQLTDDGAVDRLPNWSPDGHHFMVLA
jgi:Tol biopolymer transport system component